MQPARLPVLSRSQPSRRPPSKTARFCARKIAAMMAGEWVPPIEVSVCAFTAKCQAAHEHAVAISAAVCPRAGLNIAWSNPRKASSSTTAVAMSRWPKTNKAMSPGVAGSRIPAALDSGTSAAKSTYTRPGKPIISPIAVPRTRLGRRLLRRSPRSGREPRRSANTAITAPSATAPALRTKMGLVVPSTRPRKLPYATSATASPAEGARTGDRILRLVSAIKRPVQLKARVTALSALALISPNARPIGHRSSSQGRIFKRIRGRGGQERPATGNPHGHQQSEPDDQRYSGRRKSTPDRTRSVGQQAGAKGAEWLGQRPHSGTDACQLAGAAARDQLGEQREEQGIGYTVAQAQDEEGGHGIDVAASQQRAEHGG